MHVTAIPSGEPTASTRQHSSRGRLRPVQLAAVIFLTVSGGPYGLEPLFSYVGDHGAMLLLLVTPILWDIPTILTVLELNSMMPVTGGYYQWVKHALGIRWAFYEGWWTWLYTFIDLAIYPVLFVGYAAFFFPEISAYKVPVCLLVIWGSALLNILGIVPVGKTSLVLGIGVLIPFLALFIVLLTRHTTPLSVAAPSLHGLGFSPVAMGLYTVMWNFIGWDNATTYAGEVKRPVRSYLVSVSMAFLLIVGVYLLAALAVHQSGIDATVLNDGGFPVLGVLVGGRWLGILLAAGGMASTMGLYSAVLLSVSRVPQVMAADRLLPEKLCALHPRFKTPYISIIASSCIVSILILWTFSDLVIMDIMLYGAGLSLEFITLLVLRIREPLRHRPFAIPLKNKGLIVMILLPLTVYVIALSGAIYSSGRMAIPVFVALGMLLSAEIVWRLIRWRNPRLVLLILFLSLAATAPATAAPRFRALVLYENGGHHIQYSRAAKIWLDRLAADSNFSIDYITTPTGINDSTLSVYRLFIQLDYPPYGWPAPAVLAFQKYIETGKGGWIGFHHATLLGEFDGYPIWQWFSGFMGGIRWKNYIADFATADVKVEDRGHPCMNGLPSSFPIAKEEWYTYDKSPRPNIHVIASVDESSYIPDSPIKMGDHPVIWTNDHVAARNLYIFMGHSPDLFENTEYTTLFRNAIFWAAAG